MMKKLYLQSKLILVTLICFLSVVVTNKSNAQIVKGADISYYKQQNVNFKAWSGNDINWGNGQTLFQNLKNKSLNAVRIRIWVNSQNQNWWNSIAEAKIKAQEAANNGMYIMLTLHYSDWWAHPGQQYTPGAWPQNNKNAIRNNIWSHTVAAVQQIRSVANGNLKWVQIGNEINTGMCFPTGNIFPNGNYNDTKAKTVAEYITAGHNAVKSVDNSIITIAHSANSENYWTLKTFYDAMKKHGALYDMIGLSLYPSPQWWNQTTPYANNLTWLRGEYNKPVMLVEFGMPHANMQASFNALKTVVQETAARGGKGVFYWEPQAFNIGDGNHTWWNGTGGGPRWSLNAFTWNESQVWTQWNLSGQWTARNASPIIGQESDHVYSISPNPASHQISVYLPVDGGQHRVEIVNSAGQNVGHYTLSQIENTIDVSRFENGIYMMRISGGNGDVIKKFIKQ